MLMVNISSHRIFHLFLLQLFTTTVLLLSVASTKEIPFHDQNIQYYGRWQRTSTYISNSWPGAYFRVILDKTRFIKLDLFDSSTSVTVQLNKGQYRSFNSSTSSIINLFPEGLDTEGPHELTVISNAIALNELGTRLRSILVDETSVTLPPSRNKPSIEFIGHDLTLGLQSSQQILSSFSWKASEFAGLEHSYVAYENATLIDGIENIYFDGLQSNYHQQQQIAVNNSLWGVVVLLGTNDRHKGYASDEYLDRLTLFLSKLRRQRLSENAPIFILSEPLGDMYRPSQQSVLDLTQQGDQYVYFIDTTAWLRYGLTYYKDDGHLTDTGHDLLAKKLATLLEAKLTHPREPLPGPLPNPNLPGDWQTTDIGEESRIGLPGTVSADSDSTFTLWGSGADIDNEADAFRFVYQPLLEQGVIEGTVRSHSAFAKCAKAGIMVREHLGHGAPSIMIGISPAEGIFIQIRYENTESTKLIKKMKAAPPYRLRLIRHKDNHMFEAQIQHVEMSTNTDAVWESFAIIPFVLARDVYAGLAVTSCDTSVVSVAKFTEVALYHTALMAVDTAKPHLFEQQ
ncbi:hypothetical protein BDF20DRAFT_909562 [Mycotypha africana]|uniref:uncharacterized protein n=1 Tax=Mycotypha africana TaxID=64632 RepID=UPI0022FFE0BD|nr:uncharacterized protein BDF20DRAFT_909562 [Mycotypha africana]KAI8991838.1 hypothetical protein BDF20DRAFT_909562 [Mycotypha africana]